MLQLKVSTVSLLLAVSEAERYASETATSLILLDYYCELKTGIRYHT
jgi:response regulator of citrate/malate metabolism